MSTKVHIARGRASIGWCEKFQTFVSLDNVRQNLELSFTPRKSVVEIRSGQLQRGATNTRQKCLTKPKLCFFTKRIKPGLYCIKYR